MRYDLIDNKYKVSKVGIGGHYSKMEEGRFEKSYATVSDDEVSRRRVYIEKAVDAGINYFDTTWRNESDMLAKAIAPLGIRDSLFINGMVLGTFTGSDNMGISPGEYFNRWLDDRLKLMKNFDSFMINAIEEGFDEAKCADVLNVMEKRRQAGDFSVIGFSCHNHSLARKIADQFPEFKLIMTAYNYKNREFEKAFNDYRGDASFVAMKPLIWYEYGVPFCRINEWNGEIEGFNRVKNIAEKAVCWSSAQPLVTTSICAVNNMAEVDSLIAAGNRELTPEDEHQLENYYQTFERGVHIPFLLGASECDSSNIRSLFFALSNLARALNVEWEGFSLNDADSADKLMQMKSKLLKIAIKKGYIL